MSTILNAVRNALPRVLGAIALLAVFQVYRYVSSEPQVILECAFALRPGSTALQAPSSGRPIQDFRIKGRLHRHDQDRTYFSFQGSAVRPPDDATAGEVSGGVTLTDDGAVQGFTFTLRRPDYDSDELRIVTRDRDGQLGYDRSRAFLYFNPDDKHSYPAGYACRIERHKPFFV